jgi:hypothetical protein
MTVAARTSETPVNFYQTTRRNNPEDSHLHIAAVRTSDLTSSILFRIPKLCFSSDPPIKCRDNALNQATAVYFHILANSLFINYATIRRHIFWATCSAVKWSTNKANCPPPLFRSSICPGSINVKFLYTYHVSRITHAQTTGINNSQITWCIDKIVSCITKSLLTVIITGDFRYTRGLRSCKSPLITKTRKTGNV